MKSCPNTRVAPMAMAALLALAGCSPTRPPTDILDGASRSLSQARSAGAATYAPDPYRSAGRRFDEAQAAMSTHDYDAAAQLAQESSADSELGIARTRVAKARQAVAKLRDQNAQLQGSLDNGSPLRGNASPDDTPTQGFSAPEIVQPGAQDEVHP